MTKHTFSHRVPVVVTTKSVQAGTSTLWTGVASVLGHVVAQVWEADGCTEEAEVIDFLRESVDEAAQA